MLTISEWPLYDRAVIFAGYSNWVSDTFVRSAQFGEFFVEG
jgi:hypothetical protein